MSAKLLGQGCAAFLATVLLMIVSLPPLGVAGCAFLLPIPYLWLGRRVSPLLFVAIGPLTGLMAARVVSIPLTDQPDAVSGWTQLGLTLFGLVLGVFVGVWSSIKHKTLLAMAGLAAMMVLVERLTGEVLPIQMGITQYRSGLMLWLAQFGGLWFVSFLVWMGAPWLLECCPKKQRHWMSALGAFAVLMIGPARPAGNYLVAAIQTSATTYEELKVLHRKVPSGTNLVVWPELSAKDFIANNNTKPLQELSRSTAPFITTFNDLHAPLPHNVAGLFAGGAELARYEKRKPFAGESRIHAAGTRTVVQELGNVKVGLNICFDSCYAEVMRDTARSGAAVIALPTLDPQTVNGWVQSVHEAYGRFRAAELGVSIVRADVSFGSSIVGPNGAKLAGVDGGEHVITAQVPPLARATFYKAVGEHWLWAYGLVVLLYWGSSVRRFDHSLG